MKLQAEPFGQQRLEDFRHFVRRDAIGDLSLNIVLGRLQQSGPDT